MTFQTRERLVQKQEIPSIGTLVAVPTINQRFPDITITLGDEPSQESNFVCSSISDQWMPIRNDIFINGISLSTLMSKQETTTISRQLISDIISKELFTEAVGSAALPTQVPVAVYMHLQSRGALFQLTDKLDEINLKTSSPIKFHGKYYLDKTTNGFMITEEIINPDTGEHIMTHQSNGFIQGKEFQVVSTNFFADKKASFLTHFPHTAHSNIAVRAFTFLGGMFFNPMRAYNSAVVSEDVPFSEQATYKTEIADQLEKLASSLLPKLTTHLSILAAKLDEANDTYVSDLKNFNDTWGMIRSIEIIPNEQLKIPEVEIITASKQSCDTSLAAFQKRQAEKLYTEEASLNEQLHYLEKIKQQVPYNLLTSKEAKDKTKVELLISETKRVLESELQSLPQNHASLKKPQSLDIEFTEQFNLAKKTLSESIEKRTELINRFNQRTDEFQQKYSDSILAVQQHQADLVKFLRGSVSLQTNVRLAISQYQALVEQFSPANVRKLEQAQFNALVLKYTKLKTANSELFAEAAEIDDKQSLNPIPEALTEKARTIATAANQLKDELNELKSEIDQISKEIRVNLAPIAKTCQVLAERDRAALRESVDISANLKQLFIQTNALQVKSLANLKKMITDILDKYLYSTNVPIIHFNPLASIGIKTSNIPMIGNQHNSREASTLKRKINASTTRTFAEFFELVNNEYQRIVNERTMHIEPSKRKKIGGYETVLAEAVKLFDGTPELLLERDTNLISQHGEHFKVPTHTTEQASSRLAI